MFRRQRSKIVDRFIDAGSQARGGNVVAEDSAVHDLCKERRLRDEVAHQMRNVDLTFGRESLLIPRSATERDHDYFSFAGSYSAAGHCPGAEDCAAHSQACRVAQELTAAPGEAPRRISGERFVIPLHRAPASL